MSTAITWNIGPTHLSDEKIEEVGRLARSASPAVLFLQDAHRPQTARAATIKQLERACPDYKVFLGGTDAPSAEHMYPFLLITLVRKTLCPSPNRATAAALGLQWNLPDGRVMVVQLPAIPGCVRGETLLTNVYFPVGSHSDDRGQIFALLAEYAVSRKANILAGGD